MGRPKKRITSLLVICSLVYGVLIASPALTSAASTSKAKIRIVPLECIIEEVNNGISEIIFLGPIECENKLNPPLPLPGNTKTSTGLRREAAQTTTVQTEADLPVNNFAEGGAGLENQTNPEEKSSLPIISGFGFFNSPLTAILFILTFGIYALYIISYPNRRLINYIFSMVLRVWRR